MKYITLSFLIAFVITGCAKVKGPEFRSIGNFSVRNLGLSGATVGFQVTYFNPNKFGVTVKQAAIDVYVDSTYLGRFQQDSSVYVRRAADFSIPLSGSVALTKLLKLDLKNITDRAILLRAEGSARVGKAGIFISEPINYSGTHRLSDIKIRL